MKKGDLVEWRVKGLPTWRGVVLDVYCKVRFTKGFAGGSRYRGMIRASTLTVVKRKKKR